MQCLNSLKEKFAGLSGAASLPESGNITSKASSADSASSHAGVLTQWWLLRLRRLQHPHPQLKVKTGLTQANLYPQFFEEKESFGFNVADVIAQRVNDAY